MPKDMHCLRDIWHSIDKDAAIAQRSESTIEAHGRAYKQYATGIQKKREKACAKALDWMSKHPQEELPLKMKHFVKDLNLRTAKPLGGGYTRKL